MSVVDVYLASASPRRRELLQQIGVRFAVKVVDVAEIHRPGESPSDFASRLAQEKAQSGWNSQYGNDRKPVLGADTIVVVAGQIFGKPRDRLDAERMLVQLSGQTHQVISAVAICHETCSVAVNISEVTFRNITSTEAQAYWDSGEPHDKAGGYAIQGKGAIFIERLNGSYSGVMGLPLYETAQLLAEHNIPFWCQSES